MYESYLGSLAEDAAQDNTSSAPTVDSPSNLPMLMPEPQIVLPGGITLPRKTALLLMALIVGVALAWYLKNEKK